MLLLIILVSYKLPSHLSPQAAELFALMRACILAEGHSLTVYTDSSYAFSAAHKTGTLEIQKFLGKPIAHSTLITNLLDAITLPSSISVCKCKAHTNNSDPVSVGTAHTDSRAKETVMLPSQHCRHSIPQILKVSTMMIFHLITHVPWLKKLQCWKSNCVKDFCTGLCSDSHRHTALPSTCFPFLVKLIHGSEHVSVGSMLAAVNRKWFTPGFFGVRIIDTV